jgi:hypothetical protein
LSSNPLESLSSMSFSTLICIFARDSEDEFQLPPLLVLAIFNILIPALSFHRLYSTFRVFVALGYAVSFYVVVVLLLLYFFFLGPLVWASLERCNL